jgi:hypothetical protein
MKLHTIQLAKRRLAERLDIPVIDTTVKSGLRIFAPTWHMVTSVKDGTISEETYTKMYFDLMRNSYRDHNDIWAEFCNREEVAVACYCKAGEFCHRHLLVAILQKVCTHNGISFFYAGELK